MVALKLLVSHCKGVGHVYEIPEITGKLLEVTVFRLVPHRPVANQRTITGNKVDRNNNRIFTFLTLIVKIIEK